MSAITPHVPDVTTFSGLCDVMALGNLCELGVFLQRRFYTEDDLDPAVLEECLAASWRYRQFQVWFHCNHTIIVDGEHVQPLAVFRRSLLEFMAAVSSYEFQMGEEAPAVHNLTAQSLLDVFTTFFEHEYPELLKTWTRLSGTHPSLFYWTGPTFEVKLRKDTGIVAERIDFKDFQLYGGSEGEMKSVKDNAPTLMNPGKKRKSPDDESTCMCIANVS
jgi:hypothetical protein